MALLKPKDIRAMRPDDIKSKFKELSDELMHERGIAAMGGAPASPGKLRALRTNVARIHTIMREMELAKEKENAEAKAPANKTKAEKPASKPKPGREKAKKRAAEETTKAAKDEEETK